MGTCGPHIPFDSPAAVWENAAEGSAMIHMSEIQAAAARIAHEFRPQRIILFGSYATGQATEDSDVDLLVVLPFRGRGFRKSLEIMNRIDVRFPLDLVARRPAEVKRRYAQCDPLVREALDRGKVLYEQHR
jgi:predicted nucleotidyltransferase